MNFNFGYLFRKSPLFRAASIGCLIVVILAIIAAVTMNILQEPVITAINPQIGSPGDIMTVTGSGFGHIRDTNYVEIGGSRLTASAYLSWTDTEIRLLLPANVQDGLVFVSTHDGRSEPVIFANKNAIPVAVRQEKKTVQPVITDENYRAVSVGQILTIRGSNFGSVKNDSAVYFTPQWMEGKSPAQDSQMSGLEYIPASEQEFDYEYWSDTEIRVRVPDGAASGYMYVQTDKGQSNHRRVSVSTPPGTKRFSGKRTYLIQVSADVTNAVTDAPAVLTLRVPRPQQGASQPFVQMTECSPDPVIAEYNKTIIHQVQLDTLGDKKAVFTQNFVVPVFAVTTDITPSKVTALTEKNRLLYAATLAPDPCICSDLPEIEALVQTVLKRESNPYRQANLIYSYILDTYTLLQEIRPGEPDIGELLESKAGDAYDFAVLFCTLARAAGIPAIPVSGILVDGSRNSLNHWWCEFYLENIGWIPVDPSLGAGLTYEIFQPPENYREFYFGNLDSQHVAFSRGWNTIKSTIVNNKTVYRPKTYALQSIWEETSQGAISYSSLWNDPVVVGIY